MTGESPRARTAAGLVARGAVALTFGALFLYLALARPVADPDVWWHLAAGREIARQGALPSADPFGVPGVPMTSGAHTSFVLKQYWLSQLVFYGLHVLGGFPALLLLRAVLGTAVFVAAYLLARRAGAGPLLSLLLIWAAIRISVHDVPYVDERPQLWSSLLFLLVFGMMESLREGGRRAVWALPPVMCLWSNLHGGYLIGDLLIAIYLLAALLRGDGTRTLFVAGTLGILASGCNPAGYLAFVTALGFLDPASRGTIGLITENRSILPWLRVFPERATLPALMLLAGASFVPALLGRGRRRIRVEWLALFCATLALSLLARRYIVFFATLAPALIAGNAAAAWGRAEGAGRRALELFGARPLATGILVLAVGAAATPAMARAVGGAALTRGGGARLTYDGAVGFMRREGVSGNLLSTYRTGGHLIWRLAPAVKVFVDGRCLSLAALEAYLGLLVEPLDPAREGGRLPASAEVLDRYGLDLVLFPSCDRMGRILPLVNTLARDPGWALVHADAEALLFMRVTPGREAFVAAHRRPVEAIFDNIIAVAGAADGNPHLPEWMLSTAYAHWWKGDVAAALAWLDRYQARAPGDGRARELREALLVQAGRPAPPPDP